MTVSVPGFAVENDSAEAVEAPLFPFVGRQHFQVFVTGVDARNIGISDQVFVTQLRTLVY